MSKIPGDNGYSAGWCIHYRGAHQHDSCEAGVPYAQFRTGDFNSTMTTQPCFLDKKGQSKPDAAHCPHLRRPTPEEIAEHEKWWEKRMQMTLLAMTTIAPWRKKHAGKSFGETIECPVCKGRLNLSIAACNGHVHAHCETKDCVSWME